jgi:hypothetical protein
MWVDAKAQRSQVTSTTAATFVIERKAALVGGNGLELFSAEHVGGHFVFTSALKSEEFFYPFCLDQ